MSSGEFRSVTNGWPSGTRRKVSLTADVYRFLREVYGYEFSVPLGVGVKVARNWAQTKIEESWNVWPDGKENYTIKE